MSTDSHRKYSILALLPVLIAIWPVLTNAQVPVDETSAEEIPLLSTSDLELLVGPIALYPDDLLAIVLPASTYPLQLVQAERFLQDLKNDPDLKPDESWDDSIVALINYPEAVALLAKDLDKTWRLGEAVVAQQADVIAAIESFRDQAYTAGNLQSDKRQIVSQSDGVIEIYPIEEDVIYVPYYEPEQVVVYQSAPAYNYYPRAYPVYNYPYPYGYTFNNGFFWGVTTAFAVGWFSDSLHVYHHSYYGHPYYGHSYGHNYWYRQPSIHAHNSYYYNSSRSYHSGDRYGHGDYWRPHSGSTVNRHDQRVTRNRHYQGKRSNPGTGAGEFDVNFRQRTSAISNQSSSFKPSQMRGSLSSSSQSVSKQSVAPAAMEKQARADVNFRGRTAKPQSSIEFRERAVTATRQLATDNSNRSSKLSQPSRSSSQSQRSSSQPSRSSQPQRSSSQPSRSSQPQRSSSQPSRSSQAQRSSSQPRKSGSSGSDKVANASSGRKSQRSADRR